MTTIHELAELKATSRGDLARISTVDYADHPSTHDIQITEETDRFLTGWILDKEGARTHKLWVIDKTTIIKRNPLRVNLRYGLLEVVHMAP
jgi:hypothetical protein